ncbi:MAG: ABC transporter ATP-binding protein [Pseudomonadota bacterium]
MTTPLLDLRQIRKAFPGTLANDNVDLSIAPGEIHALLGENGAGKSTLVKMIYGVLGRDSGDMHWRGDPVEITSPRAARALGIGMVFQHFSLFDALTAGENIALSLDDADQHSDLNAAAKSLSERYGLPLDPDAVVGDLSVGERQRIEIIRCLLQEPDLLILDEPTSVLTPQEADKLFVTLEQLRSDGKSILYISHRLEEVQRLCDRATVLRHGKVVADCDPRAETAASLATLMVGNSVAAVERGDADSPGETLLALNALSRAPETPFAVPLRGIDLRVRAGEIVGIAGVAGNGQSELFEALSGEALQDASGDIDILGSSAGRLDIGARRALGAAFVPEERLGHGAVPDDALSHNLLLSRHASDRAAFLGPLGWLKSGALKAASARVIKALDVRCGSPDPRANELSGGNLQKFIIGRELDRAPRVLVVNQPTWGVDAGAASHIRRALLALAATGSAVLVICQDLDELFEVCHAIAVIHDGHLSEPMPIGEATLERIGLLMGGHGQRHGHSAGEHAA